MFGRLFKKKEARILILGLDAAGKTSILYWSKLGEVINSIPTIGFNVETIEVGKLKLCAWDIRGGVDKITPLWKHYYPGANGLIYVIDSSDKNRLGQAKELLDWILSSDDLKNVPLLLLANKQDAATMTENEIQEGLDWTSIKYRPLHFQSTSVFKGTGIKEGLTWLAETISQSKSFLK